MADEEAHELLRRDGGDLPAQPFERQTMNPGEQPAVAPFQLFRAGETAAQDDPLHFQGRQGARPRPTGAGPSACAAPRP